MPVYDFRTTRLFVDAPLTEGGTVVLDRDQSNYLANVLRHRSGDPLLLFNGRDGEWQATLATAGKKSLTAAIGRLARPQPPATDLHFLFAPLKHARLDYLVQKAVEMGVSRIQPVLTQHTQVGRVNIERMRANAIEAAQQCGVLALPTVAEPVSFDAMIGGDLGRTLVFCDEDAAVIDPVKALAAVSAGPISVLIGPEGGFAEAERDALLRRPGVLRLSLGPRILRADTAAVASLALIQAVLGDWRG